MVTYGRDLLRQVHSLFDVSASRLQRAFQINIADLLTQVSRGCQQLNEAVFNGQFDVGILLNSFFEVALGLDEELLAPAAWLAFNGLVVRSRRL